MNLQTVLKYFIMECMDATKGIFNTLSLRYDRACSYVLTTVIELKFTIKVTKGWGRGNPAMPWKKMKCPHLSAWIGDITCCCKIARDHLRGVVVLYHKIIFNICEK